MPQKQDEPHDWKVPPKNWAEGQARRVGLEVRRRRGARSAQWLANLTAELGSEVSRAVISDLEVGRRRYVTTAELLIFAQALRTTPVQLMYPGPYEDSVMLLPHVEVPELWAAQWFSGLLDHSGFLNGPSVDALAPGYDALAQAQGAAAEDGYRSDFEENQRLLRDAREVKKLEGERLRMISGLSSREFRDNPSSADALRREIAWITARIDELRGVSDGG